jgi:hypothetical protein
MKVVRTFELPNIKLLAIKFEGEELDALETLQKQWNSTEYLRAFFETFQKDYFQEYGRSDRARLVKETKKFAAALFERLITLAQVDELDSISNFFKPLDNRELESDPYDLQKLKARGLERKSLLRIYGIKYRECIIVTSGAIKLTKKMKDRPHTKEELYKLEIVRKFLFENGVELISGYLDIE